MNFSRLSFLLLIALFWSSCGDDDDAMKTCTQADWVGTYAGSLACDTDPAEDVTVTITANGADAFDFSYAGDGFSIDITDPITPDNCGFSVSGEESGITVTITGTLDGDNLVYTEVITGGTGSSTCTITATRN